MKANRYQDWSKFYCILLSEDDKVLTKWISIKSQEGADNNTRNKYYEKYWVLPFYNIADLSWRTWGKSKYNKVLNSLHDPYGLKKSNKLTK